MSAGVLAVDAGQSGIRLRLGDASPTRLPGLRTDRPLVPQLAAACAGVLDPAERVELICAGVSGLTNGESADDLLDLLTAFDVGGVVLAHDSITSYLGAVGTGSGVVIAAGTGVVVLAVGASTSARVDGWGHIMGDAGSALGSVSESSTRSCAPMTGEARPPR